MTKIIKVKTGSPFEEKGSYSRIVKVDNWIYVSNTAGRNPETKIIPDDIAEQTLQVFANVENALKAVGAGLEDAIFSRVYVQEPKDIEAVMSIVGQKFKGIDPATTITCPPLGSTVYKVEIELTAFLGTNQVETEKLVVSV